MTEDEVQEVKVTETVIEPVAEESAEVTEEANNNAVEGN